PGAARGAQHPVDIEKKHGHKCRLPVDETGQTRYTKKDVPGCCAVGSAPALGAGGREFESRHSDQEPLPVRPEGPAGSFLMCGDRDLRYEGTMASAWAWVR